MTAKSHRSLLLLTLGLLAVPNLHAQTKKLTTAEAKDHIGDRATACGKVVSTHSAKSSKGEPYPKEVFTILIWGSDREKFGAREDEYKGLRVCVAGRITSYRSRPQIVATERAQIEAQ